MEISAVMGLGCSDGPDVADSSPSSVAATSQEDAPQAALRTDALETAVTFYRDIAPLVFNNCTSCHRKGQVAPFPLETYRDVASRAEQVADVTESRFMPPWKPVPGHGEFAGSRRLTDGEVALFRRWAEGGAPAGDEADQPALPNFPEGWLLGEPDLVVRMSETYMLPAGSSDEFRSFVIPIPIDGVKYVRGMECRPTNPKVVHHADILFDPTRHARELDSLDPIPGFEGMRPVETTSVGHLTGWAPGGTPILYPEDMTWTLSPESDLVLTLHMLPSGKPEPVDFMLGFYFSDQPPSRPSYIVRLASTTLDIPPEESDYVAEDSYVLPVDVEAVGLRPHAHYLGKRIEVDATLPDKRRVPLLLIDDWDFNWQDDYRFKRPIRLPRGTELKMKWVYDNSSENVRNQNSPPQRVTWGARSSDEMGTAMIQIRLQEQEDYNRLVLDLQTKGLQDRLRGYEATLKFHAEDPGIHNLLDHYYQIYRDKQEIVDRLEKARRNTPDDPFACYCLAVIREIEGDLASSSELFRKATQLKPDYAIAHFRYGRSLLRAGSIKQAIVHLTMAADALPRLYGVQTTLGLAQRDLGNLAASAEAFNRALAIYDEDSISLRELGLLSLQGGDAEEAERLLRDAVRIAPDDPATLAGLGLLLIRQGKAEEARAVLQEAVQLDPDNWQMRANLGSCLWQLRDANGAIEQLEASIRLNPKVWNVQMTLGSIWVAVGELEQGAARFEAASQLEPQRPEPYAQAARAWKLAGKADEAFHAYREAYRLGDHSLSCSVALGWMLATHPQAEERSPSQAMKIISPFTSGNNPHPMALDTLAAAYAADGKFDEAIQVAGQAKAIAQRANMETLAERIAEREKLYKTRQPFVEQSD